MSYYFSAQIKIDDPKGYEEYVSRTDDVFSKYKGEYLCVDNCPVVLEGEWNYTRSILIRFDSKEDFQAWYNSEDYQNILKYRLSAAQCDSILIKGLDENK